MTFARHRCSYCSMIRPVAEQFCPDDGHEMRLVLVDDQRLGDVVDGYQVVGTRGDHYLGREIGLGRSVLLTFFQGLGSHDDEVRARASLASPFTAPVLRFGHLSDGQSYLVTEAAEPTLADPEAVAKLLAGNGLRQTLWGLCHSLQEVHRLQSVHGGLGPQALSLQASPLVRVSGYRLNEAGTLDTDTVAANEGGDFCAPELLNNPAPTSASDMFAVGAIARWCLAQAEDRQAHHMLLTALESQALERCLLADQTQRPTAAELVELLGGNIGAIDLPAISEAGAAIRRAEALLDGGDSSGCLTVLAAVEAGSPGATAACLALQARASFQEGQDADGRGFLRKLTNFLPVTGEWVDVVRTQRAHAVLAHGSSSDFDNPAVSKSVPYLAQLFQSGRDLLAGKVDEVAWRMGAGQTSKPTEPAEAVFAAVLNSALATLRGDDAAVTVAQSNAVMLGMDHGLWVAVDIAALSWNLFNGLLGLPEPAIADVERPPQTAINVAISAAFNALWKADETGELNLEGIETSSMAFNSLARALIEWMVGRAEFACGEAEASFTRLSALRRQVGDDGWILVKNLCAIDAIAVSAAAGDYEACETTLGELRAFTTKQEAPLLADLSIILEAAYVERNLGVLVAFAGSQSPAGIYAASILFGSPKRAYWNAFNKAFRTRWSSVRLVARGNAPDWVLDAGVVTTGSGEVSVTLTSMNARLLTMVVAGGGSASKAELVKATWGIATYEPLRDDNRLHVAMKRLRFQLRPLGLSAVPVVTLPDGYGLNDELDYLALVELPDSAPA